MTLNKKEQNIVMILGVGAAVLLLYFGGNWWTEKRTALEKKRDTLAKQDAKEAETLRKGKLAQSGFEAKKIQTLDPAKMDMAATDRLVKTTFDAGGLTFTNWGGQGARAVAGNKEFMEAKYIGTATTTTARLARFLQYIETAKIPARIDVITITTPKPGVDNLRVVFNVSALLYLPQKGTAPGRGTTTTPGPEVTRPAGTTLQAPPPPTGGTVTDAEMKRLEEALIKRRQDEAARLATQPVAPPKVQRTPEEIEADMIAKRLKEEEAATAPAPKP